MRVTDLHPNTRKSLTHSRLPRPDGPSVKAKAKNIASPPRTRSVVSKQPIDDRADSCCCLGDRWTDLPLMGG